MPSVSSRWWKGLWQHPQSRCLQGKGCRAVSMGLDGPPGDNPSLQLGLGGLRGWQEGHPGLHTRSRFPALNPLCEESPDNPSGLPCRAGAMAEPLQVHRAFGKCHRAFVLLVLSCVCHPVCPPTVNHCGHLGGTRGNGEAQPVPSEPLSGVMLG